MTMVELLVGMALGLVIALAAFGLIEVTSRITGRVSDQVSANQVGRQTLQLVEQELAGSCIAPGGLQSDGSTFGPIQYGLTTPAALSSDSTHLVFWTVTDPIQTAATYATSGASYALHELVFANNTLTDTSWPVLTGTTPSTFTYGQSSSVVLGEVNNLGVLSQSGTTPVFQYYTYNTSTFELNTTPTTLTSSAVAANVAAVAINFQAEGTGTDSTTRLNGTQGQAYQVSDQIDLRLTAVENPSATNEPAPCQ